VPASRKQKLAPTAQQIASNNDGHESTTTMGHATQKKAFCCFPKLKTAGHHDWLLFMQAVAVFKFQRRILEIVFPPLEWLFMSRQTAKQLIRISPVQYTTTGSSKIKRQRPARR